MTDSKTKTANDNVADTDVMNEHGDRDSLCHLSLRQSEQTNAIQLSKIVQILAKRAARDWLIELQASNDNEPSNMETLTLVVLTPMSRVRV